MFYNSFYNRISNTMAPKTKTAPAQAEIVSPTSDLMDESASPSLAAPAPGALLPATGSTTNTGSLLMDQGRIAHELGDMFEAAHVGGSLPLITWTREQQSFVGIFRARDEATDEREFACLVFDMIDTRKLAQGVPLEKCVVVRAQLVSSYALEPYFTRKNAAGDLAAVGELLQLTYVGEVATKRGQSKMKLITVSKLATKAKAVPAAPVAAPVGK